MSCIFGLKGIITIPYINNHTCFIIDLEKEYKFLDKKNSIVIMMSRKMKMF